MNRNLETLPPFANLFPFHKFFLVLWCYEASDGDQEQKPIIAEPTRSYCLNFCEHDHFLMIIISCRANNDIFPLNFFFLYMFESNRELNNQMHATLQSSHAFYVLPLELMSSFFL